MSKTAMGEALERAGMKPGETRLRALAEKQLARFGDEHAALPSFYGAVNGDAALMAALLPEEFLKASALGYLRRRRIELAREGGLGKVDAQAANAPLPTSRSNGGGLTSFDTHEGSAPAGSTGEDGHQESGVQNMNAVLPREPSAIQKEAARQGAQEMGRWRCERFKVTTLDGQLLPNVHPSAYERMEKQGGKEQILARLMSAWRDRKVALLPPSAVTGDFISSETLDAMIKTAEHVVDHGIYFADRGALLEYMESRNAR